MKLFAKIMDYSELFTWLTIPPQAKSESDSLISGNYCGEMEGDSGWWNRISSTDREAGVENLQSTARAQAESSGMLEEARRSAEERIKDIVQKNGSTVEFPPAAARQ
jgi:hypothetical protein